MITMAKGLTSGYAPLGGVMISDQLGGAVPQPPSRSSTTGSLSGATQPPLLSHWPIWTLSSERTCRAGCVSHAERSSGPGLPKLTRPADHGRSCAATVTSWRWNLAPVVRPIS